MPGTKPIVTISYVVETTDGQSDIRNKAQAGLIKAQEAHYDQILSGRRTEWESSYVRFKAQGGPHARNKSSSWPSFIRHRTQRYRYSYLNDELQDGPQTGYKGHIVTIFYQVSRVRREIIHHVRGSSWLLEKVRGRIVTSTLSSLKADTTQEPIVTVFYQVMGNLTSVIRH